MYADAMPTALPTTLPEDLLLLCADPQSGRIRKPQYFELALAGAVLGELLALGAGVLVDRHFVLTGTAPTGRPDLDAAVAALDRSARTPDGARLRRCLRVLQRTRAKTHLDAMTKRGLVERSRQRVLGLIPVARYTLVDAALRAERVALVEAAVHDPNADGRSLRLAALANAGDLTPRLYPGPLANRPSRRRLRELTSADPVAAAVHLAISSAKSAQATAS